MAERGRPQVVEVDEAGLVWFKSSASNGGNDTCLEVADRGRRVLVRCSRDLPGTALSFSKTGWAAFVRRVRRS